MESFVFPCSSCITCSQKLWICSLLTHLGVAASAVPKREVKKEVRFDTSFVSVMNEYHTLLSLGGTVPIPSVSSAVPAQSQLGGQLEDRYAALAELDNELSTTVSTGSSAQG